MSIGGLGPCEPFDTPGSQAPERREPLMKWREAALLISSLAAAVVGTVLVLWGEASAIALLGFALLLVGMGTGFVVEVVRHRRIRAAGNGAGGE